MRRSNILGMVADKADQLRHLSRSYREATGLSPTPSMINQWATLAPVALAWHAQDWANRARIKRQRV